MSSLGGHQGAQNVSSKAMAHRIPFDADNGLARPAMMYLHAM